MSYLTHLKFGKIRRGDSKSDELDDLINEYLASLLKNGQIEGDEYSYAIIKGEMQAYLDIARPDAMLLKNHSEWGKEVVKKLKDYFKRKPSWKILEDNVPARFSSLKSSKSIYMFTHAYDYSCSVCRVSDGVSIPLYLLPLDEDEKRDFYWWYKSHQDHDKIWLECGKLEVPAYKQLADVRSELNQMGLEIRESLEKKAKIPTYYYLARYWGREKNRDNRKCPNCGGKWHTKFLDKKNRKFWEFPFCCKKCRLVSGQADTFESEAKAKIGEYKK